MRKRDRKLRNVGKDTDINSVVSSTPHCGCGNESWIEDGKTFSYYKIVDNYYYQLVNLEVSADF